MGNGGTEGPACAETSLGTAGYSLRHNFHSSRGWVPAVAQALVPAASTLVSRRWGEDPGERFPRTTASAETSLGPRAG